LKALVLEKRGDLAAVLREDGIYTTTKQPCEVGETIELEAEIVSLNRRKKPWARVAVAAVLALAILGGSYTYLSTSAYAYVSLDSGDTSVEVTVSRLGRVISVRPLNESSEETAASLAPDLRGKKLEDALPEAMERIRPEVTEDDAYIIAGVTSGTEKHREALAETVERAAENLDGERPDLYTFEVPPEERKEAGQSGMSGGRFAFEQRGVYPQAEKPDSETEPAPEYTGLLSTEGTTEQTAESGQPPRQPRPPQTEEATEDDRPAGEFYMPPADEKPPEENGGEATGEEPQMPQNAPPAFESSAPAEGEPPAEAPADLPGEYFPPMQEDFGQEPPDMPREAPPAQGTPAPFGELPPEPNEAAGPPQTGMAPGGEGQLPPPERQ